MSERVRARYEYVSPSTVVVWVAVGEVVDLSTVGVVDVDCF